MDAHFRKILAHSDGSSFISSSAFSGIKPGYYFGRGDKGLGYYVDSFQNNSNSIAADDEPKVFKLYRYYIFYFHSQKRLDFLMKGEMK